MRFRKRVIATDMEKCYAVCMFEDGEKSGFLVATEVDGPIRRFDLDGNVIEDVAEGPGGVMTVMQSPGRADQVLATSRFYSFDKGADDAQIVAFTKGEDGGWKKSTLCDLPYVHRFGTLVGADGRRWLMACTIKGSCGDFKNDWSSPGAVYAAPLPDRLEDFDEEHQLKLEKVADVQLQNHGFLAATDAPYALVGTGAGVFRYTPPASEGGEWDVSCLIVQPTSDMAVADLDGDGEDEIVTISPFHGDTLSVWHVADQPGTYRLEWVDAEKRGFLHAIWAGELGGEQRAVIGGRGDDRELLTLRFDGGRYVLEEVDRGAGPANCLVFSHDGGDHILVANRETDEVALYDVVD